MIATVTICNREKYSNNKKIIIAGNFLVINLANNNIIIIKNLIDKNTVNVEILALH